MGIHPVLLEHILKQSSARSAAELEADLLGPVVLVSHLPLDVTANARGRTAPTLGDLAPMPDPGALELDMVAWPLRKKGAGKHVFTIGRDPGNDVVIPHTQLSKNHARITVQGQQASIEDLGSVNGTFLRAMLVDGGASPLHHGDVIRLGRMELLFLETPRLLTSLTHH